MSLSTIKTENFDTPEKRRAYAVSIVGCSPNGIAHACLFADAGFTVICVDPDQTVINLLAKGKTPTSSREQETKLRNPAKEGCLKATSDIREATTKSHIIIIAVPAKLDRRKKADYSDLEKNCKQIGLNLKRGSLVIVTSTVGIGTMESSLKEILENSSGLKVGSDFGLAYSPIPASQKTLLESLADCERIAAADDKASLNAACTVLKTISKNTPKQATGFRAAEAAALIESTRHYVSAAMVNELALFCEKTRVDYYEVQRLTSTSTLDMLPSPTLEDEAIEEEPWLLMESAENLGSRLRMTLAARESNEEMTKRAVNLISDALKSCGKTLRRSRVSILGISQMPNVRKPPRRVLEGIVKLLEARGAKIKLYDPYISGNYGDEPRLQLCRNVTDAVEGADCLVLITGHDQFRRLNLGKLKTLMKAPRAIVDFEGLLEPGSVEKEGFIYRGLGRGTWAK